MRALRLGVLAALALAVASTASAGSVAAAKAPTGLKPFLLRASEAPAPEFRRTPSFSWSPVRGAVRYEFQLAKSPSFSEGSIFWEDEQVRMPAVSVPLALPWMTGNPYAVYARVRAVTSGGVTPWSRPYGFNVRWSQRPRLLSAPTGLGRWTPVEGATSYDVWFTRIGPGWTKTVSTRTPAIDFREAFTFHPNDPAWAGEVRWRVRAVRAVYGASKSSLPAVTYGPWSTEFVSTQPPVADGPIRPVAAQTFRATSKVGSPQVHELTPAFAWEGGMTFTYAPKAQAGPSGSGGSQASTGPVPYRLYRAYVFSDSDCVNVVYRGAIVGTPAWAPRLSGTLAIENGPTPDALQKILPNGSEGVALMADNSPSNSTERVAEEQSASDAKPAESKQEAPKTGAPTGDAKAPATEPDAPAGPFIDLWESGWPHGRFYVTIVPVYIDNSSDKVVYRDVLLPQDQCAAGNVIAFGKESTPVVAGQGAAYASGLSPKGRLVASRGGSPTFYGSPLVAWQPVQGATQYQVQWSRTKYPWKPAGSAVTYATSATLELTPGTWFYRVRAINSFLPGSASKLRWSVPLRLSLARPTFQVLGGKATGSRASAAGKAAPTRKKATTRVVARPEFQLTLPTAWKLLPASKLPGYFAKKDVELVATSAKDPAVTLVVKRYGKLPTTDPARLRRIVLGNIYLGAASPGTATWVAFKGRKALRFSYDIVLRSGGQRLLTGYLFVDRFPARAVWFMGPPSQLVSFADSLHTVAGSFRAR